MPLKIWIRTEIYSRIARFSLG